MLKSGHSTEVSVFPPGENTGIFNLSPMIKFENLEIKFGFTSPQLSISSRKVIGPEITHLRAETEFWEGESFLKYFSVDFV